MDKNMFLILLFVHIVGDFYLQTENMAEKKKTHFSYLGLHFLSIILLTIASVFAFYKKEMLWYLAAFILSHILIDTIKYIITSKMANKNTSARLYWVDQMLHIAVILIISIIYRANNPLLDTWHIFSFSGKFPRDIAKYILIVLMILKPTNITFRELFSHIKPNSRDVNDDFNNLKIVGVSIKEETYNIGKLVGNMERLLVVILLSLGQYTAIGLVFTAKSITRYEKITKDKVFAEYYLLGTLFSMLATIIVFIALYNL
jgi:hypothetical protein